MTVFNRSQPRPPHVLMHVEHPHSRVWGKPALRRAWSHPCSEFLSSGRVCRRVESSRAMVVEGGGPRPRPRQHGNWGRLGQSASSQPVASHGLYGLGVSSQLFSCTNQKPCFLQIRSLRPIPSSSGVTWLSSRVVVAVLVASHQPFSSKSFSSKRSTVM